jgi:hypothetical protein
MRIFYGTPFSLRNTRNMRNTSMKTHVTHPLRQYSPQVTDQTKVSYFVTHVTRMLRPNPRLEKHPFFIEETTNLLRTLLMLRIENTFHKKISRSGR